MNVKSKGILRVTPFTYIFYIMFDNSLLIYFLYIYSFSPEIRTLSKNKMICKVWQNLVKVI